MEGKSVEDVKIASLALLEKYMRLSIDKERKQEPRDERTRKISLAS